MQCNVCLIIIRSSNQCSAMSASKVSEVHFSAVQCLPHNYQKFTSVQCNVCLISIRSSLQCRAISASEVSAVNISAVQYHPQKYQKLATVKCNVCLISVISSLQQTTDMQTFIFFIWTKFWENKFYTKKCVIFSSTKLSTKQREWQNSTKYN